MNPAITSLESHSIRPYATALEREHQDALADPSIRRPLAGLLESQAQTLVKTGRVVVVRHAGPSTPFREP